MLPELPVYTVSALTGHIRRLIDGDDTLRDLWVEGELSNVKYHTSGHLYFTLKDEKSQLQGVMWRSDVQRQRIRPQHGDKIRAHGKISVYEPQGAYQLYADLFSPLDAVGDLHARFRALWDKLQNEGLFDDEIKRPLPRFPQRIGVVTSQTTAAFQDICNVLRRRWPMAEVFLSPTPVQGEDAAPQIVAALRRIDAFGVDVILLARGGGSLEDLWCFNDERIARAIRETRAPVVTGVGHETDTTLVDGAADRRAPTPSAGAELITLDHADLRRSLHDVEHRLTDAAQSTIGWHRDEVQRIERRLRLASPVRIIADSRQRLDELNTRLGRTARGQIGNRRALLTARIRTLELANPRALLQRGYAIVTRAADGQRVRDAADAAPGTEIAVHLGRGQLTATVKEQNVD